jgi:hypothetical protein
MNRKLKRLGLALIAVFALGAVSVASASAGTFTANGGATISGEQVSGTITGKTVPKLEPVTVAGTWKCTSVTFTGTAAAAESPTLELAPTYSGCSAAGFLPVTIDVNSCKFVLHAGTSGAATVDVRCPSSPITITIGGSGGSTCQITIGGAVGGVNQGLGGITLDNSGTSTAMDILATIDLTGINYIVDNGPSCPNAPASGTYTDGALRGVVTIKSSGAAGITVD